jgi:hypothetical protein
MDIKLDDNTLIVKFDGCYYNVNIDEIKENKAKLLIEDINFKDSVLYKADLYDDYKIVAYVNDSNLYVTKTSNLTKYFISVPTRLLSIKKRGKYINISFIAYYSDYLLDDKNTKIDKCSLSLGNNIIRDINLKKYNKKLTRIGKILRLNSIYHIVKIPIKEILENNQLLINNSVNLVIFINGEEIIYKIKKVNKRANKKYNYLPLKSFIIKDSVLSFRLNHKNNLIFVKRNLDDLEKSLKYKIMENKISTSILILLSKIYRIFSFKKINIYFEKYSSRAEEGTFQLFEMASSRKTSRNYFILDKNSEYYQELKDKKNVIAKYSFKYYIILYAADNIISTEAPMHVNILRTINKKLRKNIYKKKFIFLQHGIIYLKSMTKNSSYNHNKEAEPNLFVASSKKEAMVVNQLLRIPEENILTTGIPIYDLLEYNHITNESDDVITIMLTWKSYEEQIDDFENSTYYKTTLSLYKMLCSYVNKKNIIILSHPKVEKQMMNTMLKDNLYKGKIASALSQTKLLITDYSSVCYNVFYQGGAVIFYQPDLVEYEESNGKLIPNDDEYIGYRCFNESEIRYLFKLGLSDGKIDMNLFRTDEFDERYKLINQFNDSKNIERIYQELIARNYI